MEVVDGFWEWTKSIQTMTDQLILKWFPVWFGGVKKVLTEWSQASEGTSQSTLSSGNSACDTLWECYKYNTNMSLEQESFSHRGWLTAEEITEDSWTSKTTEGTEDWSQTLVEDVLTNTGEGTLDFLEESAEDWWEVEWSTA